MAPNETTPLLNTSEQCTPVSIVEDDTYTAALLRRSSIVLSELGEDFPPEGHIFIEVVQSPFEQFSYRAVFTTRLVLAMLMTVALGAYWVLEYSRGDGMIFWFRFGNLVWLGQTFYMWVVAIWSAICVSSAPSLPYTTPTPRSPLRERLLFTLAHSHILTFLFTALYTLVTTLPFPSTLFYLLVLLPNPASRSYPAMLPELGLNIVSSIIAFFEIFVLASVGPVQGRRCTHYIEQCGVVVLVVLAYCMVWVKVWRVMTGLDGEGTDWRLLGGWRKDREGMAAELACVAGAYFYGVVEFLHYSFRLSEFTGV